MYTTCGFCSGSLGGDGSSSGLGVGKRFAFDAWKSRAWVICQRCGRWNLTPFDTRIETIEALERLSASGRVAATSEQVSLIRAGGCDVVRVGQPRRVELATWRYGERLKARERERLKVLVPTMVVFVGATIAFNAALGGSFGYMIGQIPRMADGIYTGIVGRRKVAIEPPICAACGNVMVLRARHVRHARLTETTHHDLALLLSCPRCHREGALLEGPDAELALRSGLTYVNLRKARRLKKKAAEAATFVDRHGGPEAFIHNSARMELTVSRLEGTEALALEMAVDEQAELRELERQWRQAEEIADIADNLAIAPAVEQEFRRLKGGDQPTG
ncbi:MAG: hypothetical protein HYR48_06955 [Gemmatimonadetes bacterium]|nr:hypothetical protein [Gemmatimonadota bacterium]